MGPFFFKIILAICLLGFSSIQAAELSCRSIFSPTVQPALIVLQSDPENLSEGIKFEVRDKNNDEFTFDASLFPGGRLRLNAFLAISELGIRSSMSGQHLYNKMIKYYGLENINRIVGLWLGGTNYDAFLINQASGQSLAESALNTWSGRQAAKYGFTEVQTLEVKNNSMTGETEIYVEFTRPLATFQ